jgi:toxin ParE1/3/4
MARQLRWSPEAIEDVESIGNFIARDSAYYAKAVAYRIVSLAETIPENPQLGRVVPEINDPDFRERFVHKYRVIYRVEPARILIAAIIHGSRDLDPLVEQIHRVQEI